MSTMQRWQILVVGKLVEAPRGPIIPGLDYRVTGRSAGFPAEIASRCHPHRIGLGNRDDHYNWHEYKWNDVGGGVVTCGLSVASRPWVLAARIRSRPENGEGMGGRRYVQSIYAAVEADQWHVAAVAALADLLKAEPMTDEDGDLPTVDFDAVDAWSAKPFSLEELRDPQVREPLVAVMSGHPISIKDWSTPLPELLDRASVILACIPKAIGWRVPVGVGLAQLTGDVALGWGQATLGKGLRIVGGQLGGAEEIDRRDGERYVAWFERHCRECRTRGELIERVASLFDHLAAAEAIDPAVDWARSVPSATEHVAEQLRLEALHAYLAADAQAAAVPDMRFDRFRQQALNAVLRRLEPRGWPLLEQLLEARWHPAWQALAESDISGCTLGWLLGLRPAPPALPTEEILQLVSAPVSDAVAARLRRQLDWIMSERRDAPIVTPLLQRARQSKGWLRAWYDNYRDVLFFEALGAYIASTTPERLADIPAEHPLHSVLDTLLSEQLRPLSQPQLLARLVAELRERGLLEGFRQLPIHHLMHKLRVDSEIAGRDGEGLLMARIASGLRDGEELAGELARLREKPRTLAECFVLASHWSKGRNDPGIASELALRIGEPFASFIVGIDRSAERQLAPEAQRLQHYLLVYRWELVVDLWRALAEGKGRDPRSSDVDAFVRWVEVRAQRNSFIETGVVGLDLLQHYVRLLPADRLEPDLASLSGPELWLAKEVARRLGTDAVFVQLIRSPELLVKLHRRKLLHDLQVAAPAQELFHKALSLRDGSDNGAPPQDKQALLSELSKALADLKWGNEPIWRLLSASSRYRGPDESEANELTPEQLLLLAARGYDVSGEWLDRLPLDVLDRQSATTLGEIAERHPEGEFAANVMTRLVHEVVRLPPEQREDLDAAFRRVLDGSDRGLLRRLFGRRNPARRPSTSDQGGVRAVVQSCERLWKTMSEDAREHYARRYFDLLGDHPPEVRES